MKRTSMMLLGWLGLAGPLLAQQLPTPIVHQISAAQAVELALKQRAEVLNARLNIANQEAINREITGSAYPQVGTNFNLQRNFNIPVTVLPDFISPSVYGVLEKEGVRDGNGNPIKFDGIINTFPAAFGVPWTASLGISVQQLLFQPDVFVGLKARKASLELYKKQAITQEQTVKKSVLEAYHGVLIAQKGLGFAKESEKRISKLYSDQEQLFKNGFIEKLDLEKTKVTLNNLQSGIIRLTNLVQQSYAGLKLAMGLPQADSLVLSDSLTVQNLNEDLLHLGADFKMDNRPEIATLKTSDNLLGLQIQRYKMQAYPTVAAFWNMATAAQRQKFDFFDTKQRWFFSNIAGLSISVPLTDGGQRQSRIRQANIALDQNRHTMRQVEQSIDFEIVSARTQMANALEALNNQLENKELAEKVYATTKIKYEQGLGSSFEVLQAETALQDALNNYYQSMYNAAMARIGYQKALGKL